MITLFFLETISQYKTLVSNLLAQFKKCSGLWINRSKSKLLWLGSLRYQKDTLLNLRLSEEPIYALGVHFLYDEQLAAKKNCFDWLDPLRRILSIWSSTDTCTSIYGRIDIVKTIAISKLTFICSVLNTKTSSLLKLISWSLIMYGSTNIQRLKNLPWLKVKIRRAKHDWFHIINFDKT